MEFHLDEDVLGEALRLESPVGVATREALTDREWMERALIAARRAESAGEVPIGAVVVLDDRAIGEGQNGPIGGCDPTAHAEIVALRAAARQVGNYRLTGATLYATVEPCLMCVGALVHARIGRLVYAASDPKVGATALLEQLSREAKLNHRIRVEAGLLGDESAELLRRFFERKRSGEVPKWS